MLNDSIHYRAGMLYCDEVAVADIVRDAGTPVYIYSLKRTLANYRRIADAFAPLNAHIHYSAKANGNLAVLKALVQAGAGIDCVSGGEIYRALAAGCPSEQIVFAGVGKTVDDLQYAVEQRVGWINVENMNECHVLNDLAAEASISMRVALRFNPDIAANTIKQIATGHGGAKFGLSAEAIRHLLDHQHDYRYLRFEGIHVHIGSQLGDTHATEQAVRAARDLVAPYPMIRTLDIGGGLPVAYRDGQPLPDALAFARALAPLTEGFQVILEPGRSIIADAGLLVASVLYLKSHGGQQFAILDTGMSELIRPALYEAHHEIVPVIAAPNAMDLQPMEIVGPVCETTDTLAHGRAMHLPHMGDLLAILDAGAYGYVMASNYNARPRPPEVVVAEDGQSWRVARRRETWTDLVAAELEA
jgi:diaminopimelate decarboxylase